MSTTIHRAGLNGHPQCGGGGPMSTTGHTATITCPACKPRGIPFEGRDFCGLELHTGDYVWRLDNDGTIRCAGCYQRMRIEGLPGDSGIYPKARFGKLVADMECGDLDHVSPSLTR